MRAALITVFALASTMPAWADNSLQTCAEIKADSERLACYDALAARVLPQDKATTSIASEAPGVPTTPAVPSPSTAANPASEQLPDSERRKPESSVVHAHIVGSFSGWHEGTKFTLDNGQIWRVAEEGIATYRPRDNPAVKVQKGFLGSYLLEFDELNARVKVERVR